jgi:hypothetical protein
VRDGVLVGESLGSAGGRGGGAQLQRSMGVMKEGFAVCSYGTGASVAPMAAAQRLTAALSGH